MMKLILTGLLVFSSSAFAQVRTLEQDIRTKYCYLTVTEQIIIPSSRESVMVGNIRLQLTGRDYQRTRRLLPGRTFKIRSVNGAIFSLEDGAVKSFCLMDTKDCSDVSDSNKVAISSSSEGALKMICEDRPLVDI